MYAVGMLKFSTQNFSSFFYILNKIANKYNIPVMINAVSIERGDVFDWRFRKLASSLHFKNVRVITIRDGEREALILKKDYISEFNIENRIRIGLVGDPALWVREVYQYYDKPRKKRLKEGGILGICVIRLDIYNDYEGGVSRENLFDFYKRLLISLDSKGIEWELFCNGLREDYEVGVKLLNDLGYDNKYVSFNVNPNDYIKIVNRYSVVCGSRLHSCIVSYALDVPCVGLVWDNKLRSFFNKIKFSEFSVESSQLNEELVIKKILLAEQSRYDEILKTKLMNDTYNFISAFFDDLDF